MSAHEAHKRRAGLSHNKMLVHDNAHTSGSSCLDEKCVEVLLTALLWTTFHFLLVCHVTLPEFVTQEPIKLIYTLIRTTIASPADVDVNVSDVDVR